MLWHFGLALYLLVVFLIILIIINNLPRFWQLFIHFHAFLLHWSYRNLHSKSYILIQNLIVLKLLKIHFLWNLQHISHPIIVHWPISLRHQLIALHLSLLLSVALLLLLSLPRHLPLSLNLSVYLSHFATHMAAWPFLTTHITEFVLAYTCHVVTAMCSLQNVSALGASSVLHILLQKLNLVFLTFSVMDWI